MKQTFIRGQGDKGLMGKSNGELRTIEDGDITKIWEELKTNQLLNFRVAQ